VIQHFVAEMRDVDQQGDRMRFRINLERFASCAAYEISKTMEYESCEVQTPLGVSNTVRVTKRIVVGNIMRAGLPMHTGMLHIFDHADSAHIGAYRKHHKDGSFEIAHEYTASASLDDAVLILCDPMLATGASMRVALDALVPFGNPNTVHIVCVIASMVAIEFVQRMFPQVHIWVGAIDAELTAKGYIVPGLGDAGDLAFGPKE
jgi:uracil phosphoribosyltransferase